MVSRGEPVTFRGSGVDLAADRWGAAQGVEYGTVLLLHGGGQTRHSWQKTGARLAAAGWTAIAIDARGHGDSEWAADADYGVDAMIADLREVVATLQVEPVLVGASMGGITSLIALGQTPDLARGLVLVDVTPRIEAEGSAEINAFMRSGSKGFSSLEEAADAVTAYIPNRVRAPRPEGLRKNLRLRDGRWFWHWDPRFISDDPRAQTFDADKEMQERCRTAARSLTLPTLLVRGGSSRVVSHEGAAELQELVPTAERIDVSGAGHMVAGDDNDIFTAGLLDFLTPLRLPVTT